MTDVDASLVEQITGAVLQALGRDAALRPTAPAGIHPPIGICTGDYSKFPELQAQATAGSPPPATASPCPTSPPAAAPGPVLTGIITANRLPTAAGAAVYLAPTAKLTPLAMDEVKQRQLNVHVSHADGATTPLAASADRSAAPDNRNALQPRSFMPPQGGFMTTPNQFNLRREMCDIGHRIWLKGFCAGNEGNHSVRIAEDRVLCTPTGVSKGFLTPDQITVVDMDGNQIDKHNPMKRTSEVLLHLQIYKARPDIRAVVHSHPPHATAFAMANIPIPEGIHPEAEVFLGRVPMAKYTTPSYKELGQSVVALINKDTNTVMLANHGSVSFDSTLIGAYYKLEILDAYCRILLLSRQLGKINQLTRDEMIDLLKVKEKFGFPDMRLACAPGGCIGLENQPFLATLDARPQSVCACADGRVEKASAPDPEKLEEMVQQMTDQIMAALEK